MPGYHRHLTILITLALANLFAFISPDTPVAYGRNPDPPAHPVQGAPRSSAAPVPLYLPVVSKNYPDLIPYYLAQIDLAHLESLAGDLVTLYGPRHSAYYRVYTDRQCSLGGQSYANNNLVRAGRYVYSLFEDMGYAVEKEVVHGQGGAFNVVATRYGSLYPNEFIEIGAHLDSVAGSPGASDNAGGVAAVIEIARALQGYANRHSVRFIAFVGEEDGMHGSNHHLAQATGRGETILAGLVMDGIGWSEAAPENMNCLWDDKSVQSRRISELFDAVRQEYSIAIGWRLCSAKTPYFYSDNVKYWDYGLPAVLSVGGLPYRDPHYHECSDTMHSLDMQNIYKTSQQNLAVLLKLDQ